VSERRGGWARAAFLAALIVIAGALWIWHAPLRTFEQDRLREWVAGFGPWAVLVSIALNVVQVLLAPLPGQFAGLLNGYLYGPWLGTFYSMAGLLLGTALAIGLARRLGRPLVERLVNSDQLARWDRLTVRQGPLFFFLVFLFPFLPDDLICFLIGLSPLSIPSMLVLAALGRLPGVFVSCWVGAYAMELPWWAWIPLTGGAAALSWLFWRSRTRLEGRIARLIRRLAG